MKTSYLAFVLTAAAGTALVIACGGATDTDVLGGTGPSQVTASSTSSSGVASSSGVGSTSSSSSSSGFTSSSGATSSSSSSSSSSGCPPIECAQPPPGCTVSTASCQCVLTCVDSGTPPVDAGGPQTCQWAPDAPDPCPNGMYCNAPNCKIGVCQPKHAVEGSDRAPQCGCDGNTYWNESVAKKVGIPIQSAGPCGDKQLLCGGIVSTVCPNGGSCNHEVKNKGQCFTPAAQGQCWRLPSVCAIAGTGGRSRACTGASCTDECSAIRSQANWYDDGSCPM